DGFGLAEVGLGEAGVGESDASIVTTLLALAVGVGSLSAATSTPPHADSRASAPANTPRIVLFVRARAAACSGVRRDRGGRCGFITGRVWLMRARVDTSRSVDRRHPHG